MVTMQIWRIEDVNKRRGRGNSPDKFHQTRQMHRDAAKIMEQYKKTGLDVDTMNISQEEQNCTEEGIT